MSSSLPPNQQQPQTAEEQSTEMNMDTSSNHNNTESATTQQPEHGQHPRITRWIENQQRDISGRHRSTRPPLNINRPIRQQGHTASTPLPEDDNSATNNAPPSNSPRSRR